MSDGSGTVEEGGEPRAESPEPKVQIDWTPTSTPTYIEQPISGIKVQVPPRPDAKLAKIDTVPVPNPQLDWLSIGKMILNEDVWDRLLADLPEVSPSTFFQLGRRMAREQQDRALKLIQDGGG